MFGNFVDQFWPATVDGLSLGAIYALVALGYTLVYGVLRLINFAHSEVFMIGTFATLFTVTRIGITAARSSGSGLIGVVILLAAWSAMVVSGGAALVLERVAYRPLRRRGAPRLAPDLRDRRLALPRSRSSR